MQAAFHVSVRDDDGSGKSDEVGSNGSNKLEILCKAKPVDQWIDIFKAGKKTGRLHIKAVYTPTGTKENP